MTYNISESYFILIEKIGINIQLLIIFIAFLILAFYLKTNVESEFIKATLGISSFIFGIVIAFSTANRHSRLNLIRQFLREQDAILLNIYLLSKKFGKEVTENVRKKIDEFLILQLDYKLPDFEMTFPPLKDLYNLLEKMVAKSKLQDKIRECVIENLYDLIKIHKQVSYQAKAKMMSYEWLSLLILGGTIIFCLFYFNDGSIVSVIITALVSTSLFFLLLILRELDTLQWQERRWIWRPISLLFLELDLIPYFPEDLFKDGRIKSKHISYLQKVRIARYPNPYPDMSGKTVEVVEVSKITS